MRCGFELWQPAALGGAVNLTGRGENSGTNGIFFNPDRFPGFREFTITHFWRTQLFANTAPPLFFFIWNFRTSHEPGDQMLWFRAYKFDPLLLDNEASYFVERP